MDGDALPVELGEWLLGSVWGGVHYDQRLSRDRHGGETYTLINPREIHPEAEVDTRGVLRAAYVAAAVDSARTLRSIAQRFELLTDELLYEREPDETPPDDVARFGGGGGGVEVFPALKRLLATGDWEGAENDGDALEVAWRILKIIEGSAPVPALSELHRDGGQGEAVVRRQLQEVADGRARVHLEEQAAAADYGRNPPAAGDRGAAEAAPDSAAARRAAEA